MDLGYSDLVTGIRIAWDFPVVLLHTTAFTCHDIKLLRRPKHSTCLILGVHGHQFLESCLQSTTWCAEYRTIDAQR